MSRVGLGAVAYTLRFFPGFHLARRTADAAGREDAAARRRGRAATRDRARAVREVLEEEARADAGAGPAAGGAAGVVQAAAAGMAQAQQGPLAMFAGMLTSYGTYNALPDDEKRAYLQVRASFKHPQTELLKDCPGDITVMAKALQAALKVATAISHVACLWNQ